MLDDLDVCAVPRDQLPAVLGRLVELEARVRLRLAEPVQTSVAAPERLLSPDEAAAIAGTSRRWLLSRTRGLKFRSERGRKFVRFQEAGLRQWLTTRRSA